MTMPCPSIEALARPESLSAAEREHVRDCPRCALEISHLAAFAARPANVPAADLADAEDRLDSFLREQGVTPAPVAPARTRGRSLWDAWPDLFRSAPLRLAVSFAVVAAVAMAVIVLRSPVGGPSHTMRGTTAAALTVAAEPARAGAGLVLRWGLWPGADAYTVEIVAADLTTIASFDAGANASFTLAPGAVAGHAAGESVYCRVSAKHLGATISTSEPAEIVMP